jgi:hypothetical protein
MNATDANFAIAATAPSELYPSAGLDLVICEEGGAVTDVHPFLSDSVREFSLDKADALLTDLGLRRTEQWYAFDGYYGASVVAR